MISFVKLLFSQLLIQELILIPELIRILESILIPFPEQIAILRSISIHEPILISESTPDSAPETASIPA